jgi:hypothetical protein
MKFFSDVCVQVEEVVSHRNGICGTSFYVINFFDKEEEINLVGIVFPQKGNVAVFDRELLGNGEIGFGINSWRGDNYEISLRRAIKQYEDNLFKL